MLSLVQKRGSCWSSDPEPLGVVGFEEHSLILGILVMGAAAPHQPEV